MLEWVGFHELLDGLEIEVQGFIRQVVLIKRERLSFHLDLQGHLCVVQKPVLSVEAYIVKTLHEPEVCAHIELVLEFAGQLKEHLLLTKETELVFTGLSLLLLMVVCLETFVQRVIILEHIPDIIVLLVANLIIFLALFLEWHECRTFKARNA